MTLIVREIDIASNIDHARHSVGHRKYRNALPRHQWLARRLLAKSVMEIAPIEKRQKVGAFPQHFIVDRQSAGIGAQSAFDRRPDTEHGDVVAAVGVQVEGAVDW